MDVGTGPVLTLNTSSYAANALHSKGLSTAA
jgi:hypothetical protein